MNKPNESLNDILSASGGGDADDVVRAVEAYERQRQEPKVEPAPEAEKMIPWQRIEAAGDTSHEGVKRRETAEEAAARIRAQRASGERDMGLNGFTKRLEVGGSIPGFTLRIIEDDVDRLDRAVRHGYDYVQSDEIRTGGNVTSFNTDVGSRVRFVLGKRRDSHEPLYGYLMKIPDEIYSEDMAAHESVNRRIDDGIRRGHAPGESKEDLEGRYIPGGRVTYDPGQAKTYRQAKE